MTQTAKQVSTEVYDVLKESRIDGNTLYLPEKQLDRKLYQDVNAALTRMGGKWNRKSKGHVFPVSPTTALASILDTGNAPAKNPMNFYATPEHIAERMAACISGSTDYILEPSAGTGAIALAIRNHIEHYKIDAWLDCCELVQGFQEHLHVLGFHLVASDFLDYHPTHQYSFIAMNPPFTSEHDPLAYIAHIEHAWSLLAPDGLLMAIAPGGFAFREDQRIQRFRALVEEHGSWESLEDGAFKESGTGIRTVLIEMRKG